LESALASSFLTIPPNNLVGLIQSNILSINRRMNGMGMILPKTEKNIACHKGSIRILASGIPPRNSISGSIEQMTTNACGGKKPRFACTQSTTICIKPPVSRTDTQFLLFFVSAGD
jgi:hypothetical protein